MKILSLFDWMACWYEALLRAWIKIDKYYASEIDKYAIQIATKNHPDIIEIWDVCEIKWEDYQDIDLLIWGSPCQWFSIAWKMLNFDDPRSKLFFEFLRLKEEIKPKYFLLENVKMKKDYRDKISELLWVEPILIDSSLLSAQHRERYYWTNIPWIQQPQDKWLLLRDVLQDNVDEKYYLSDKMKSFFIANDKKQRELWNWFRFNVSEWEKKASSVTTRAWWRMDDNFVIDRNIKRIGGMYWQATRWGVYDDKWIAPTITASMWMWGGHVPMIPMKLWFIGKDSQWQRVYATEWKSVSLKALWGGWWAKMGLYDDKTKIRKLTPIECERLQTLPDNYTEWVSDTQRYKMCGNWWTVDVIAHIFRFIK